MVTLEFEDMVNMGTSTYYRRAKVSGGWLVEGTVEVHENIGHDRLESGYNYRVFGYFVPDPEHKWEGT